jgi:DNA protecting protein DprA
MEIENQTNKQNDANENYPVKIIRRPQYPFLMRQMRRPPRKIYVRGNIPSDDNKFLCIVGARRHTKYGVNVCKEIISGLRGYPVVIVSGLAIGIDSVAHEYALETGLKTIAFPGSGLDDRVIYPSAKLTLAHRILESGGALMSPFDNLQTSTPWTFPARNTLMAAISHATLIIEGREGSGTMITADNALEFGRDVLVVPGNIFSELSAGPHKLLREGAIAVRSAKDVLETLGLINLDEMADQVEDPSCSAEGANTHPSDGFASTDSPRTLGLSTCSAPSTLNINSEEQILLNCLSSPKSLAGLASELNYDSQKLSVLISNLELKDLIYDEDGVFVRTGL